MSKFYIVANPNSSEESSEWPEDEVQRIELDPDGALTVFTTDDSTCTYLADEWLRIIKEPDTERPYDLYLKLANQWGCSRAEAKNRYLSILYGTWETDETV